MRKFLILLACAAACGAQDVQVWETYGDRTKLLARTAIALEPGQTADIVVDDTKTFQTIDGFGASMTDSSSWLIATKLSKSERRELMRSLFDPQYGAGLSLLRQPMGASDFSSRGNFSYQATADAPFSIAPDLEHTVPLLREAIAANPHLRLLALPWSPPGWMKSNGSMNGGSVRTDRFPALANYFVRFLEAYRASGLPVYAVSMQNEPLHQAAGYPTALVSARDQAVFIGQHLGPALASAGFGHVKILAYDHNWDHPEYPETVLADADARRYLAGTAFHCYGGDVSVQSRVKAAYPDKDIWFTECSGTVGSSFSGDLAWNARNLLIGAVRHHARGVTLWNIALDQNAGPKNGGCPSCRGVVTIDTRTTPARIERNVEYYALAHLAKFVRPGAVRIESTSGNPGGLMNVAFRNPGSGFALLVLNDSSSRREFTVAHNGRRFRHALPPASIATFTWDVLRAAFTPEGVVNAAHPQAKLSPGAIFSIYGTDLAGETFYAPGLPLAWTMGGTSVLVGGRPAPLLYVSPLQINAQVPWDLPSGNATLDIERTGGQPRTQIIALASAGPAMFTVDGTRAAGLNENGSANTAENPETAERVAVLFGTGFGAVSPAVEAGEAAPREPVSRLVTGIEAEVGGRRAVVDFAGLAPGFAGLVQVNVRIPAGTASGAAPVVLRAAGEASNTATLAVR